MSLIKTVVALVETHGTLSTYELFQLVHSHERQQIKRAAQNASRLGYLERIGYTDRVGKAQGAGIWAVKRKPAEQGRPKPRPVSSVWELGMRG